MAKVTQLNVSGSPHSTAEEGRNPGTKFDLGPVKDVRVNRSAVERRAGTMSTRRTVTPGKIGATSYQVPLWSRG